MGKEAKHKFALVDGIRTEPINSGQRGICQLCGSNMVAKCGEDRINHWAHMGEKCDTWKENKSEWHVNWQNQFPTEWQEIVQILESGEKRIADVKTNTDWIIEFQRSYIPKDIFIAREEFYTKLIWVVDGARNRSDIKMFNAVLKQSIEIWSKPQIMNVLFFFQCKLLDKWFRSLHLVFLDFKGLTDYDSPSDLWCILPTNKERRFCYLMKFKREKFIKLLNEGSFDTWYDRNIRRIGRKGDLDQALIKLDKRV